MNQDRDDRSDQPVEEAVVSGRGENLAIAALVLGITALVCSVVPIYGTAFAIPLGVPAIVLGILARKRVKTGRGMATGGLVCGALGLVVSVVWAGFFLFPIFSTEGSATIIRTGVESGRVAPPVGAVTRTPPSTGSPPSFPEALPVPSPPSDLPLPVEPPPGHPSLDVEEGSGAVEVSIDGTDRHLELEECDMALDGLRAYLRGSGPDGQILLQHLDGGTGDAGVLLILQPGEDSLVLIGDSRGGSTSQGFDLFDRRRIELTGTMQTAFAQEAVDVNLVATCS